MGRRNLEVFEADGIKILEAGVCDAEELGGWYHYLDGDEDMVYSRNKSGPDSYADDYIMMIAEDSVVGYSIGFPRNIIGTARADGLYVKEYRVTDFAVSLAEGTERAAELLLKYVIRRAEGYGCDKIAFDKLLPEFEVFYAFLERFGAALENGSYTVNVSPDKSLYKNVVPLIEGQISKEISYRLLALEFALGDTEATRELLGGTVRVDRLTGDVTFDGVKADTPEGLNVNRDKDIAMLCYLIACLREWDKCEYSLGYLLHNEEVLLADATFGDGCATVLLYAESRDDAKALSDAITCQYSKTLHALFRAGFKSVMVFSVTYDPERECYTESSFMQDVTRALTSAIEIEMRGRLKTKPPLSLKERVLKKRSAGTPKKIRLEFGDKGVWFAFGDKGGAIKIDGRTREISSLEAEMALKTAAMLTGIEWEDEYGTDGEPWLFAIEYDNGSSFLTKGRGE